MHTLYEFCLTTQAGEYLVGVFGLIVFVLFWKFLNAAPRKKA